MKTMHTITVEVDWGLQPISELRRVLQVLVELLGVDATDIVRPISTLKIGEVTP